MCVCPRDDLAISQILSSACERSTGGPAPLTAVAAVSGSSSGWMAEQVSRQGGRESRPEQASVGQCFSRECVCVWSHDKRVGPHVG